MDGWWEVDAGTRIKIELIVRAGVAILDHSGVGLMRTARSGAIGAHHGGDYVAHVVHGDRFAGTSAMIVLPSLDERSTALADLNHKLLRVLDSQADENRLPADGSVVEDCLNLSGAARCQLVRGQLCETTHKLKISSSSDNGRL
jgi:hypothetical protein